MQAYELGVLTTGVGSGAAAAEFRAGANKPMAITEIGLSLVSATATTLALGRPGNTPAGGTAQTASKPAGLPPGAAASVGGIILSGWTTVPTAPAAGNTTRRFNFSASVGNGIVWTWELGAFVVSPTTSDGLLLWNLAANSALNLYAKWFE